MAKIITHLFGDNKKQHRQVRSHLVSTTTELASVRPINEIKIDDVAAHAQVSKGTVYKCFRSVEDLLNLGAKQIGKELLQPINTVGCAIPDAAVRVATKTRLALRILTSMPLLGKLMLKIEWPFGDVRHKGYQDVQEDIAAGIAQGCFTDMPVEIGANIVITTLRVAVQDILNSTHTEEYETQVIYTLLLSLGVDGKKAEEISKIPFDQLPDLPKKGLIGKILAVVA